MKRTLRDKKCPQCKSNFRPRHSVQKFCSIPCRGLSCSTKKKVECANCGTPFLKKRSSLKNSRSGMFFCDRKCKDTAQRLGGIKVIQPSHYGTGNGKWDYRQRAFDFYAKICSRCEYADFEQMLDVHHVNGDRDDNDVTNLEVLCVWCHGLETRKIKPHRKPGDIV